MHLGCSAEPDRVIEVAFTHKARFCCCYIGLGVGLWYEDVMSIVELPSGRYVF